jgi:NADH:ubiquinone oxidoreductase subunit F (NADH-binding)
MMQLGIFTRASYKKTINCIDCRDNKYNITIIICQKKDIRQNHFQESKPEVYRQNGGYASVEKAMEAMTLTKLLNKLKHQELRGRGAGFPG